MLVHVESLRLSRAARRVLHDVNLTLREGEIYGLLGPNGAGKTTTINAMLGLLAPEAGTVRVFGHDPQTNGRAVHARLGVLPEQNGFYDWMTAADYLAFFARLYRRELAPAELERRLTQVGLASHTSQIVGAFSRGMQQRLGLARALIGDPALLVLDEPTNGLDPRGRREVHDMLLDLAARGVGILLCTHLLDDVDRLCSRIGVIVEGRTVAQGTIAELVRAGHRQARFRVRLRTTPASPAQAPQGVTVLGHEGEWWLLEINAALTPDAAWRELLFAGWPITEIGREGGGLEDLYMALTERGAQ